MKVEYRYILKVLVLILFLTLLDKNGFSQNSRLKDIVNFKGIRTNQLIGFGLVVGLNGSGDSKKSLITSKALQSFLQRLGFKLTSAEVLTNGIAAVMVTSELPPFAKIGDHISVRISTLGDAKSLEGGTLVMTPLKAGDSKVYAVAQGGLISGSADGKGTQSFTTVSLPSGGVVEREFIPHFVNSNQIDIYLKKVDLTTNARLVKAINNRFSGFYAKSIDPSHIAISLPQNYLNNKYNFLEKLEQIRVNVDQIAVVVINEKTGTVVMGNEVLLQKVYINHGTLNIKIDEKKLKNVVDIGGATIGDLVSGLNALGVSSKDLISILQSLKASGALNADLKIL